MKQINWKWFLRSILLLNIVWTANADEAALKNPDGSWKWTNRNIKIDREERPDLDEIYMTATQLLT